MIERTFRDIPEDRIREAEQQAFLVSLGWLQGSTWDDLLQSMRVLLISEAGAGKTHECSVRAKRLWDAGEPAFFIDLTALAQKDLRSLLDMDEEARFDSWHASQSDVATFFLDSIDELKLTSGSFELALKGFKKGIGSQLQRTRIVITTRPVPFDKQLVRDTLPVPSERSANSDGEAFADIAMRDSNEIGDDCSMGQAPEWRTVGLMPLSDEQIVEFARNQRVDDPDRLLEDLQRRNALEFARRPQDLIELCADWREHRQIRTHREQVETNVRVKLLPGENRHEPAELSVGRAIEGASKIALASQMTRRQTIRFSAASDTGGKEAALDPAIILPDWKPNERRALLERALFGFASYGRVRFHHRSVAEYLAAERLSVLRKQGMSLKALKRLLFAETKGKTIVRPSKRSVASWLALKEDRIFQLLRDNEPAVLLDEGDPESLTQEQRIQAIRAYAERYGPDGWRGLQVPRIQAHRFASGELADEINRIWKEGVENPELRVILMNLIDAGCIVSCSDIAVQVARDATASNAERMAALDALVSLDEKRLTEIATGVAEADVPWSDWVAQGAILRLFPRFMSIKQLCQTLRRMKQKGRSEVGDLSWHLPRLISRSSFDARDLEELRDGLVRLVSEGMAWQEAWPHITSARPGLCGALAATCALGLEISRDERWLRACMLALRLHYPDHGRDEPVNSLRERLTSLNADDNSRLFWVCNAWLKSLHDEKNPWDRLRGITGHHGPVQLRSDRDLEWIKAALGDSGRDAGARALLLEAAVHLSRNPNAREQHYEELKRLVVDEPSLTGRIDDWVNSSVRDEHQSFWELLDEQHRRLKDEQVQRRQLEERRKSEERDRWIQLWCEVADHPETAFSREKGLGTARELLNVMAHDGGKIRSFGWNRRFIEGHFNRETADRETADRLRQLLMKIWRDDRPIFPSEIPKGERYTNLARWDPGLAGIFAEAEEPEWASALSDEEARLAARYALIQPFGLPQWIEALAEAHPGAVDQTLGKELSWELKQAPGTHDHSRVLQAIAHHGPESVARKLMPRLEAWLSQCGDRVGDASNENGIAERTRRVARVISRHGDEAAIEKLKETSLARLRQQLPFALCVVWFSTLMRIDPAAGVEMLEERLAKIEPAERSEAVTWFACLFGDRDNAIGLGGERFAPRVLLRLVRLAYLHVRIEDDAVHDGTYTPDARDDAEQARNSIVTALLNAKGEEGLAVKLEMAVDPLCEHFKDRILAMAEEAWAQEIDADALDDRQAAALDQSGEAPALTNESMFAILKDRLSDLDELLMQDGSPREAWAGMLDEKLMRREIARELGHAANSVYKVDQEAVTAEEKETDIRLLSTASAHEAVIELKLGDKRYSAQELRNAIESQLVRKYMAADNRRAGALLMTLAEDKTWKHPDDQRKIDVDGLLGLLNNEADRVQAASGGTILVAVHFLDLRPRLRPERSPSGQVERQ